MAKTSDAAPAVLTEQANRAREIVEGLGEGFLSLDADWRFTDCNRATERFLGRSRQELLGRTLSEVSGISLNSEFGVLGQRVAETRVAEEAEVTYPTHGEERLLHVQVFPLDAGIGVVWRDISEIRAAERRLAESEARYRELADDTPAAAWLSRADRGLEFINQAMADALGRPRAALLGEGWLGAVDPADRPRLMEARTEVERTHRPFFHEARFRRPDGGLRIIQLYGRPRFDRSGAFLGHVGMATDMTEVRAAEQRQKLLIDELNHRVKNTLTTVQSLLRQGLREAGVAREVESVMTERLLALAAAHDVLTRESWVGAQLADVAHEALKPYLDGGRIAIAGPKVRIAPNVAIVLSMALHELATNALKHGALSIDTGQARLSWTRADKTIALEWRESGGPAVKGPEEWGFGSRLLSQGLAGELGEPAELIFAPEGLICRIRAPAVASVN